jgi:hypothetical protein
MKNELWNSFKEGFKDSFRLAICLFVGVASIIGAFANHSLDERSATDKHNHQPSSN